MRTFAAILILLASVATAQDWGNQQETFEGDITTTARDITFANSLKSYEICFINDNASGGDNFYVLKGVTTVTTITAGNIANAAARESADVITIKPQESPCLQVNWRGISIIASGTASYRIYAFTRGGL